MAKVILLDSPSWRLFNPRMHMHLGIMYLAASLRAVGHEVQVVDCHQVTAWDSKNQKLIIHTDQLEYCDILGISATTANVNYGQELARVWPAELKVLGGSHVSHILHGPHRRFRKREYFQGFDYLLTGECEGSFTDFVGWFDKADRGKMEAVPGVAWFDKQGELHRNPLPKNPDVTKLPIPAFDLWKGGFAKGALSASSAWHREFDAGELMTASLYTARGCPYGCTFCSDARTTLREETLEQIRDELRLLEQLGVRAIRIQDDTFTIRAERCRQIAEMMDAAGMLWRATTRVNLKDESLFRYMAQHGCTELGFGIESGSKQMLKIMNKGTTPEMNEVGVRLCQDAGMFARAFIMIGYPGETLQTIEETRQWVKKVKPDMVALSLFTPFPGSDVFNHPEKYGVQLPDGGFEKYWQFGMEDDPDSIFLELPTISKQDLFKARKDMIQFINETIGEIDRTRLHGNIGVFGKAKFEDGGIRSQAVM